MAEVVLFHHALGLTADAADPDAVAAGAVGSGGAARVVRVGLVEHLPLGDSRRLSLEAAQAGTTSYFGRVTSVVAPRLLKASVKFDF